MNDERPALFRNPVAITATFEEVPPPPEGPELFGLSYTHTIVEIGLVLVGDSIDSMRQQCKAKLTIAPASDANGVVVSITLALHDRDGKIIEHASGMIDAADVRKIGSAVAALIDLTPKPPTRKA